MFVDSAVDNENMDDDLEVCSVSESEDMSVSSAKYPGDPIVEAAFRAVAPAAVSNKPVRRSSSFTEGHAAKRQCLPKVHSYSRLERPALAPLVLC